MNANTTHTLTVGGQPIPLDPPRPPEKPHMLLWVDVETTGISRTKSKLLEIGMVVTGMDGATEHDRFVRPVRPDTLSLYDLDPKVLRMHLDNHLLDTVMDLDPHAAGYRQTALDLSEFLSDQAARYELHPAGTNVDYDIDLLTNQLAGYIHPDYLRELTNHRKLDLSTFRLADTALDVNPYKGHTGTHRVTDCITRDRNDYAAYLDLLRIVREETES
ncbi:exonuclease domain-containing protein [Bifidobacterium simiiventris]|uniref:exonuclease domain-containing protein n=1 Tax=Bifidobacterium simiiventris TaxID=2834434 RepID=UPI001C5689E0|nr:exonuclease domain-containing protein [Bifidobacterium simiiventris]MBW3077716.1 ribonuclease [Bifidobacterium simiiventris]